MALFKFLLKRSKLHETKEEKNGTPLTQGTEITNPLMYYVSDMSSADSVLWVIDTHSLARIIGLWIESNLSFLEEAFVDPLYH